MPLAPAPRALTTRTGWLAAAACLLLAGACTSATPTAAPTPIEPDETPTSTPVPPTPVAITPTPVPSPTPVPEPTPRPIPLGLITPTGVTVAVLGLTADGILVRSPCGHATEVTDGTAIDEVSVVLDPGHGGAIDTGAVGPNGLVERDLNLRLAEAVVRILTARDITVSMTRTGDYLSPLAVRSGYADDLEAEIMVSIHHNAPIANPSDRPGTEVFVQTGSGESRRLGGLLYEEVSTALGQFDVPWTTALDAGVLEVHLPDGNDAYGMIRRPETPTALVELGYLANGPEEALFATDEYTRVAATALADAIEAYLHTDRNGTGHGNPAREFTPSFAPGADVCDDPPLE